MTNSKKILLGFQHLFAMFGATILVPTIVGLNPSVTLITAGVGTLVFHWITGNKVPVFLGSSFAFVTATQMVVSTMGIPYTQGGIIFAGLVYVALSLLVAAVGSEKVRQFFPPVVTGPVIVVIGVSLSPNGISDASTNWPIAIFVLAVVIGISVFAKGFFKLVPILIGLLSGYLVALIASLTGICPGLIDLSVIAQAPIINPLWKLDGSFFTLPKFDLTAILAIAPIAFVTFMEHIGDITTNGTVVGKDFFKDPGLHRTLLGDGIATLLAGLAGGPANTTYSENTGVLAVTKVYDIGVIKLAAVFAIILGTIGKFGAVISTIPNCVKGGMEIMLFGMIAAVGMRTLAEANLDFTHSRNLIIVALILVFGLGMSSGISLFGIQFSGLFVAVLVGALANKILPENI